MNKDGLIRSLDNEASTLAFGQELSLFCRAGLVICLYGDLGAGKTTLARALIQSLSPHGDLLDVPSPTFALLQPYEDLRISIHHYDLYRIDDVDEAYELGLFDDLEERLTIIEWPERLGNELPTNRIDIQFSILDNARQLTVTAKGNTWPIVQRMALVATFLEQSQWKTASRQFLQGDASARRYERLTMPDNRKAILMDMPTTPDGAVIKNGKTYSEIAHIAEGIKRVAAINQVLIEKGYSAPASLQSNLQDGLMIIEDFGDKVFRNLLAMGDNISEPMETATQLLADMATKIWPSHADKETISDFDYQAFEMEASLLLDWFWPMAQKENVKAETRDSFFSAWAESFSLIDNKKNIWVLRDFHSPNLIWLPEREGVTRVGLIDTQDCLMGHCAYDLVSMLQDARVDLPDGFEAKYFEYYCQLRLQQDKHFDKQEFAQAYAVLGAQRATKILGIFARLYKRDGKPGYLKHIPRVSGALEKNLSHPSLTAIANWYNTYLPVSMRSLETVE